MLHGSRVLVLGLGQTGIAVAAVCSSLGASVLASESGEVTPTDIEALASAGIEVESEGHDRARSELDAFDVVIPSPGISPVRGFLAEIVEAGMPVWSELELGGRIARANSHAKIVAVTGTNGKTTVVRLVEHMARCAGLDAYACGNLETKFVTAAADHPDADVFVVEAPSFVLAFCPTFRPDVSVITSLAPDHIDWHGTFEHYRDSKAQIAAHQTPHDLFLYPAAQPELASFAPSDGPRIESFTGDGARFARFAERGKHFAADAEAAAAAASAIGIDDAAIDEAIATFSFDPHRLAPVGALDGVRYVDDAVSANPLATLAALQSFSVPVVLIAGGRNKGADLGVLGAESSRLRSVVAIGEAADEIATVFADAGVFVGKAASMREAVSMARDQAQPGDVVLLSPACASWDMFNGYADRGRTFVEVCRALGVA